MTAPRGGLSGAVGLATAAAGTTWLALFSWRGFTEQSVRFLGPLLVLGAVVAGTGAVARWARLSAPLVVLLQVLLSGALASTMLSGTPIPVGPAWGRLVEVFRDALASAERYAAPVPSHVDGVHPVLIAGGLVCLLLVDVLACTLRRVPMAGLPLLTIYSVPVSLLVDGVTWWIFAASAGGFILMLFLQENEQIARWGRPLGTDTASDPTGFGVRTGAIRATAGTIGGAATAIAVFLPLLIPTLNLNLLEGGIGPGGSGISLINPMADLRRDLQRGDDIPLIRVRTTDPNPHYLRIAVLNRFSDNEWSSGDRDIPTNQRAVGPMPDLVGVAGTLARTETRYDVAVSPNFGSVWLPTQPLISSIDASGDWRYDEGTMDFLAGDKGLTTAGLEYSLTGVELAYSAEAMARAPSSRGIVADTYTELPDGLPAIVSNTAFQVTRNVDTRFEKAQAMQQWFREDGGFTYDLTSSPGNGTDDLVRFLTEGEGGRTGYCEQFASAMAVLARSIGIPARVAVGFLEPQKVAQDTWEYSAWDMHAWPELFFPGSGWVRFEPTPPGRASGVPPYTTEQVPQLGTPGGPGNPQASDELPSRGESADSSPSASETTGSDGDQDSSVPWAVLGGGLTGLVVVAGLLLLPRTIRQRRTRARLTAGPEAAWAELRDAAIDLQVPWPDDRSPRETRHHLVRYLGAPVDDVTPERPVHGAEAAPLAVAALDRIVLALERLRYSRAGRESVAGVRTDLETTLAGLQGGASRAARRRAAWWPRSVLARTRRGRRDTGSSAITVRYGGVVDHVG